LFHADGRTDRLEAVRNFAKAAKIDIQEWTSHGLE
jgi:hypothetical protein